MLGSERLIGFKNAVAARLHPAALPDGSTSPAAEITQPESATTTPFSPDKPIEPLIERVEGFLDQTKEQVVFEPKPIQRGSFDLSRVQTPHTVDPHIIRTPRSILNPDGNGIENDAIYKIHLKGVRVIADRQQPSNS